jgi:uncharacterized membrane protein
MATTRKQRRSVAFMLALAVVIYAILSIGIGVATADRCGEYRTAKTWSFVPPGWVCQ